MNSFKKFILSGALALGLNSMPSSAITEPISGKKSILWLGNLCVSKTSISNLEKISDGAINSLYETLNSRYERDFKNSGVDIENSVGVSVGLVIGPISYQFNDSNTKIKPRDANTSFKDAYGDTVKIESRIDLNLKTHEICYNFGNEEDNYHKTNGFYYGLGGGISFNKLNFDSSSKYSIGNYTANAEDIYDTKASLSATGAVASAYLAWVGKIKEKDIKSLMGVFGRVSYNSAFNSSSAMIGMTIGNRIKY